MELTNGLNERQTEGVLQTEGPVLILAGAGSGKTRTIIHRIAYILKEEKAKPWEILALTFTNKAAEEMRERIRNMNISGTEDIWMSTFHALCAKLLRYHAHLLEYDRNFAIYDTTDIKTLLKNCVKELDFDEKTYAPSMLMNRISALKERGASPSDFTKEAEGDFREEKIAKVYALYQSSLIKNNAMDFDDLLVNAVRLLTEHEEVLAYYQNKFKYVVVDEYQDTNPIQFKLTDLLSQKYQNICVCGDDDQSIYAFRGADIRNILEFEKNYPNARVIKLEQNYRSTPNIIEAANHVICNNTYRKDKKMWTDNPVGEIIKLWQVADERDESNKIAAEIKRFVRDGEYEYKDFAVLYRTNAQSRVFEESFMSAGLPYKMVGGTKFYARQEIKDIVAYLTVLDNPRDDLSFRRIINTPKRGIGQATVEKLQEFAEFKSWSLYEVVKNLDQMVGLSAGVMNKLTSFQELLIELEQRKEDKVSVLIEDVIVGSGYMSMLEAGKMQNAQSRIENLRELVSAAVEFENNSVESNLTAFLENVSLYAETDSIDEDGGQTLLMTLHNAKGLEFPVVFVPGLEEGIFPHERSKDQESELQEERRLCYVGMTRAKERLYLSYANMRTVYGRNQRNFPSRFIEEIPEEYVEYEKDRRNENRTKKAAPVVQKQSIKNQLGQMGRYYSEKKEDSKEKVSLKEGVKIEHKIWGEGTVIQINGQGKEQVATVAFPKMGVKKIAPNIAPIKIKG
ncbi:MAG TPA: DNA helicase PcrA [Eubacteriaceae bacterium]|nr:DNA helicase PcrA [Eubacteriaceae bacterium]